MRSLGKQCIERSKLVRLFPYHFDDERSSSLTMAFSSTSLTPSRPAPRAPQSTPIYNQNNNLGSSGYSSSFTNSLASGASSSGSSYSPSYSGIGGSPNRYASDPPSHGYGGGGGIWNGGPTETVVREGHISVKEDGFASWLWRPKYLVLKTQTLEIKKTEASRDPLEWYWSSH